MKLLGSLLVTIGLIVGTLSATTAYLVPIDRIDPDRDRMVLHAPAGKVIDEDDPTARPQPVLRPGPPDQPLVIQEDHLAALRDAATARVHVKQFSLRHWREWWVFALACTGLLIGSLMVRTASKRELAATAKKAHRTQTASPSELLDGALQKAKDLQRELEPMTDGEAMLRRIMRQIEELQDEHFEPFVFNRAVVINQLGMGGYAQLMDRFAAAERQFNRAWSAAADDMLDEAEYCLANGIELLAEARTRLSDAVV
jgi:hypothetical protein